MKKTKLTKEELLKIEVQSWFIVWILEVLIDFAKGMAYIFLLVLIVWLLNA